jgi:phosphatidylethanolamine/phosphatidyl-N-methylethanolamine N-methyltransferase
MTVQMPEVYWAQFLAEFIHNPLGTGSLVPSSSYLARMMVQQAGLEDADAVLEYGPGTGVFTHYILRELRPHSRFAAIEINPRFAAIFRAEHPGVPLFEDSVENVHAICESMQIAEVDCVISGLPWAFFPKSVQIMFLDQMMKVLKPGGTFVSFGYLHSLSLPMGRNLAALLPTYFTTVSRSIVWFNLPPALIYRCRR